MNKAVTQYLSKYAEPECALLLPLDEQFSFQCSVVIPAYKESFEFIERFINQFQRNSVLLILVVNQPEGELNEGPQQSLVDYVAGRMKRVWSNGHLSLYQSDYSFGILLVERFTQGHRIPPKQGVGLARKIGADLACKLISQGKVRCSWVGSTDADALLPDNYFVRLQKASDDLLIQSKGMQSKAATFQFQHVTQGNSAIHKATELYEQWLNYYVAALRWAESPYAFHTIGSCLVFDCTGYCQVRGFPKRAGGEDFYLLNKMAKLATITEFDEVISLQSRLSDRVPFGTGPAVQKLIEQNANEEEYLVYNPEIFEELRQLQIAFRALYDCCANSKFDEWLAGLSSVNSMVLQEMGFKAAVDKILSNCKSEKSFSQQIHSWFDAFRTLKYVHAMEELFPRVSLVQARTQLRFEF